MLKLYLINSTKEQQNKMELLHIINELSNIIIFINSTLFYIFIFGRDVKVISRLNIYERWMLRVGLAAPSLGSLYNVLIAQYPPFAEILVNIGYASLWTWASMFHYKTFIKPQQ